MTPEAKLFAQHYREADEETAQLGAEWYPKARNVARRLARRHGCTLAQAAGVMAALSPRMRWSSNVDLADRMLGGEAVHGVFAQNLRKAERILYGERPLDVLGGDKVRAFYRAIMAGGGDNAVIDVWMMRAAGWEKGTLTSRQYEMVAEALREAARAAGIDTAEFQAVVWTQVRGGAE